MLVSCLVCVLVVRVCVGCEGGVVEVLRDGFTVELCTPCIYVWYCHVCS